MKKDKKEACEEVVKLQRQLKELQIQKDDRNSSLSLEVRALKEQLDREKSIVDRLLEKNGY